MTEIGTLLRARNIAIVGASERSGWSRGLLRNLRASPGVDNVWLVSPKYDEVHGERAYRSVADVDGPVDMACIVVGPDSVVDALRPIVRRGIRHAVVIAGGFAEAGPEGVRRSQELKAFCAEHGVTIIGPNTAGLANIADGIWPLATTLTPPFISGGVGLVSQSGGVSSQLLRLARARGVGISAAVGVGNELVVDATAMIRYFVADPGTTVIGAYLEGFRDVDAFIGAALEAAEAGKPIVVMKVGRTEMGQAQAASHTGAIVGDDGVVEAALRRLGVVRVDSMDELIATVGLLAQGPPLAGDRVGMVSGSGATCAMAADRAGALGLPLPELAPKTITELSEISPARFLVAEKPR